MHEGLRLVEEREAKLKALQEMLRASIAEGGSGSDLDLESELTITAAELAKARY